MTASCPHTAHARRKTQRPGETTTPAVERVDDIWHVRSLPLVKEVLRAGTTTVQAGFNVDMARKAGRAMREPILYMDGPEHRRQRSMIARYFAPATVSKRYRDLMESRADALVADATATLASGRTVDLSAISLQFSVAVAAAVIGLTASDTNGMARRLERVFSIPAEPAVSRIEDDDSSDPAPVPSGEAPARLAALRDAATSLGGRFTSIVSGLRNLGPVGLFYARDVRPAIAARRREPQEDVISHLIEQGYDDSEILTECLTYAAAGMVTTREYICIVTWHLLEDPELRRRYLHADQPERYTILHEILRLEPVVGHLYRRATTEIVLEDGQTTHRIPRGAVLDLDLRAANADPEAVGADPLGLCPERKLAAGVRAEAMSFGDGNHRCPGNSLAIQETDILLTRLLSMPLALDRPPRLGWLDLVSGYEVRGLRLRHNRIA